MKHTFMVLAVILLLASPSLSQNVGIGNTAPLATLSVGSSSQFRVNSTGNIIRINNMVYSFPSSLPTTQQYLKIDGTVNGNLTWAPIAKMVIRVFAASPNAGSSDWLIDLPGDYATGDNSDPTLVLTRGFTYQFSVTGGHPLVISDTVGGAPYTGVTGSSTATVTFTVPMDAPATLYYYCDIHPAMAGTITIL